MRRGRGGNGAFLAPLAAAAISRRIAGLSGPVRSAATARRDTTPRLSAPPTPPPFWSEVCTFLSSAGRWPRPRAGTLIVVSPYPPSKYASLAAQT